MKSSVSCCDADDSFSRMVLRPFAILAFFVVAKVQEKLEKFGKGELDVVRGALIPLAVLGLVYRYGVGLMIRGARRR